MNLALLVYDISLTGGAEHVALNLASEFSKIYKTFLVSIFDHKHACDAIFQYETFVLSKQNVSITMNLIKLSARLRKYIRHNEIDILIAITAGVVTVANLAAINTRVKTIYTEHSNLENKTYGIKHQLRQFIGAKVSNVVVTLTDRDKENFIRKFRISEKRVYTIPNWYVSNIVQNDKYDINSKKIISVGRIEKVKGYNYLIEVAKSLYLKFPDWKWDVYGEGSLYRDLQEKIEINNLNNFIELKGNVAGLKSLYKDYSIYVMTSLYEGLPMSLLEAQTAGLPIVSFDCPTGPAEIIEDGINGIIVKAYDIEEMIRSLEVLMKDADLRNRFSAKSKINLNRFNKKSIMEKWVKLLQKLYING